MSTTRKLMLLYALIPRNVANAPQITFDTAVFSWSGKRSLTKEHLVSLQHDILKTTRDIIETGATSHTVIELGWKFDNVKNKQREIEINNSVSFHTLAANKAKFVRIPDLVDAKESSSRTLSAIYQKTNSDGAVHIFDGSYMTFDPDEKVIVIN